MRKAAPIVFFLKLESVAESVPSVLRELIEPKGWGRSDRWECAAKSKQAKHRQRENSVRESSITK